MEFLNGTLNAQSPRNDSLSIPIIFLIVVSSSVASLATIGGNILVLIAFLLEKSIRTPSNYFIISLASTDLLIGLISMNLFTIYLIIGNWPLSQLLCDLWLSLDYTACLTSQYTVLFITVDRFCSVKIPATYRLWRTKNKVIIMVLISWLVPSSIFFTCILGWPYFNNGRQRGATECYAEFTSNTVFNTVLTIVYFWVTLIVMCVLYAGIYRVAKRLQASSDKRKGMNTLLAMAGQTMSRIGVGVSWGNADDLDEIANPTVNFRINEGYDSSNKEYKNDIVIHPTSPYKLNAPPNLVKNLQYIDEHSSDSEEIYIYKSIYYNDYNSKLEPGISEILPLNKSKNNNYKQKKPTNNTKSMNFQIKSAKQQSKKYQSSSSNSNQTSLQRLQFTRFTFIHRKDTDVRSRNRARKALRTISLILGAFVTCWTPYHVLVLIKGFCNSCVNDHLYNLSYWLCYINSPINPFCYALANSQIKTTFMRLLRGDFRRNW
uniref:GCR043 n=1 Tax=Schmidtea mediterranea TaxID=79327 RepID=A0A193KUM6_SCHMD|nr:GCR043 [Schmidtea mediterranea]